jgi:hypothetical protein
MVAGLVRVNAVVAGSMMVKAMRSRIHKIARTHVGGGRPPVMRTTAENRFPTKNHLADFGRIQSPK